MALFISVTSIILNFDYTWGYLKPFVDSAFMFAVFVSLTWNYLKGQRCLGYDFVWLSCLAFASLNLTSGIAKTFIWFSHSDLKTKEVQYIIEQNYSIYECWYIMAAIVIWTISMFYLLPKFTEILSRPKD